MQQLTSAAKPLLDQQKGSAAQKAEAMKQVVQKAESTFNDIENNLKPQAQYISILLGVTAFFAFQFFLMLVSLFSGIIVYFVFLILRVTRFTHNVTEKREVTRLVLTTVK